MIIAELDLHVHSCIPMTSLLRPEKIVKIAKRRDLNRVAITDHGTIQGGPSMRKLFLHIGAENNRNR